MVNILGLYRDAYNMPGDQLCGTVNAKISVLFSLPTRSYRVLIAINQRQLQDLLFLPTAGIVDFPRIFKVFNT